MTICPHCQTVNHAENVACTTCGAPLAADPALAGDPFVGREFGGRFRLESIVGSGEIGMVYRGTDTRSGRAVAVKIIHPDVAATHGDGLLRAARQTAKLRHAKIGIVLGASREPDGTIYVVSEFLEGETLKDLLQRTGPVGPRRAADILFQLCSALASFHRAGRPHANLKPENVFLLEKEDGGDAVKVVDAGSPELFGLKRTPNGSVIIGTPKYFSPEQAVGSEVGLASDHFTLGVIGYQLVTGAAPFFGATPDQLLSAIAEGEPKSVGARNTGVVIPEMLQQIIHRCLQKDPAQRYPDLRALATDLAAVIKSTQPAAPAPRKKKPFGAGRDMSTVVAGPDLLAAMQQGDDDDDDDDDATMMADLSGGMPGQQTPIASSPPPSVSAPPPPSQNDMASIPEPLMFTGALDGDDLAAALASASASVDADGGPVQGQTQAAAPSAGGLDDDDLMAAISAAAADVDGGGSNGNGGFDPFADGDADLDASAPPPAAGAPISAATSSPRLSSELLFDESIDVSQTPAGAPAGPLATAADFAALSPADSAETAPSAPTKPAARSGGAGRTVGLAFLFLLLAGGGAAAWYFTQEQAPKQTRKRVKKSPKKAPPKTAAVAGEKPEGEGDTPAVEGSTPTEEGQAPKGIAVRLESQPEGATVFLGEEELGKTPLDLDVEGDAPVEYTLKHADHDELKHSIDPKKFAEAEPPFLEKVELPKAVAKAEAPKEKPEAVEKTAPKPAPKKKPRKRRRKPKKKKLDKKKLKNPFG